MISRRGFLGTILALGVAPAIVRADSLMRIIPRDVPILLNDDWTVGNLVTLTRAASLYNGWQVGDIVSICGINGMNTRTARIVKVATVNDQFPQYDVMMELPEVFSKKARQG